MNSTTITLGKGLLIVDGESFPYHQATITLVGNDGISERSLSIDRIERLSMDRNIYASYLEAQAQALLG